MSSNEEKMSILRMLQEGKIKAEEAAELLSAIDSTTEKVEEPSEQAASVIGKKAHFLLVRVTDLTTGKKKVNVRLPLGLIRTAMKFGGKFNVDIDGYEKKIDTEMLEELINDGQSGPVVDVVDEEDNEHVEVSLI